MLSAMSATFALVRVAWSIWEHTTGGGGSTLGPLAPHAEMARADEKSSPRDHNVPLEHLEITGWFGEWERGCPLVRSLISGSWLAC